MPILQTVSDAESHVMELLWQQAPQAAEELAATLLNSQGWQASTTKTLINRLLKKGAVSAVRDGRRFLYSPQLGRDTWLSSKSISLIDRLFGGGLAPLVAQFAAQRKLCKEDIAALKASLKEQDDD